MQEGTDPMSMSPDEFYREKPAIRDSESPSWASALPWRTATSIFIFLRMAFIGGFLGIVVVHMAGSSFGVWGSRADMIAVVAGFAIGMVIEIVRRIGARKA
jgi:hypothetical protein